MLRLGLREMLRLGLSQRSVRDILLKRLQVPRQSSGLSLDASPPPARSDEAIFGNDVVVDLALSGEPCQTSACTLVAR